MAVINLTGGCVPWMPFYTRTIEEMNTNKMAINILSALKSESTKKSFQLFKTNCKTFKNKTKKA
jgi:hypothetical protein